MSNVRRYCSDKRNAGYTAGYEQLAGIKTAQSLDFNKPPVNVGE